MLEVCVDSLESALNAIIGGADELELCSSLVDGGLTPSVGLVKEVMKMIARDSDTTSDKKIKINVMLRCRGGDDFVYSDYEMDTMIADLKVFKELDVDRFVFGALTKDSEIDIENCTTIVQFAHPKPVTFHRAFDLCKFGISGVARMVSIGFNRLLTSGRKSSAADPEAIEFIKDLLSFKRIEVMPGGGVNVDNVRMFIDIGCGIVHSSCKNVVNINVPNRSLTLGTSESNKMFVTDPYIVARMKKNMK